MKMLWLHRYFMFEEGWQEWETREVELVEETESYSKIQYGQFELGVSAPIKPGVNFEGAIALNPETGTFEAGAGFIELVFTAFKLIFSILSVVKNIIYRKYKS